MDDEVETTAMEELLQEFPELTGKAKAGLKNAVQVAMHGVRETALDDLNKFSRNHEQVSDAKVFSTWLTATKERYEAWLARL